MTILDAEARGCDLFDLEELRMEYDAPSFENLMMCQFVDDGDSIFPLTMLQPCMVESWDWPDFKPFAARPFGDRQVWLGYDPAENGDSAGLVVLAPPTVPGGKFRILDRFQFRGMDFEAQAEKIRQLTQIYWVTYIGCLLYTSHRRETACRWAGRRRRRPGRCPVPRARRGRSRAPGG